MFGCFYRECRNRGFCCPISVHSLREPTRVVRANTARKAARVVRPALAGDTQLSGYGVGTQSQNPGFDPLAGAMVAPVFLSLLVSSCADFLFVPDPPSCVTARSQICAHVKDPRSICRKRAGLTSGGMETRKHYTQGKTKEAR